MAYTVKDQDDIINDILLEVFDNVSEITDANIGSILRTFVEAIAIEIEDLYDSLDTIYEGTRIDTATSTDLEQIGKIVGITRNAGTSAEGYVTFLRNTIATADFTIPANAVVSTQPNTGDEQLRYSVVSDTVFDASISAEEHTFYNGIIRYAADERFLGNTSAVVISGLVSGVTTTMTSYVIESSFNGTLIDADTVTLIDDCDDTTGWTSGVGALSIATSAIRLQGTASLSLGKTITTSDTVIYYKTLDSAVSGQSKNFVPHIRLNSTSLDRLSTIKFYVSDNGTITQSYEYDIDVSDLTDYEDEWYNIGLSVANAITNGNPSISNVSYVRITLVTGEDSYTLSAGDVLIDFLCFAETENYVGDVILWNEDGTLPDSESTFYLTYTPLSKEVLCQASAVGEKYNVNANNIIYKVTNVANITSVNNYDAMSGGSDVELDASLRSRILYASELQGKATSEALRQAVLGVSGVASCTVDSTPLRTATGEIHTFTAGTASYKLDNEVWYLDDVTSPTNVTVVGTAGSTSYTFLYGTDFVRVTDANNVVTSYLQWQVAGTSPDDGTDFTLSTYQYEWLGHVDIFVTGVENPLPSSVLSAVETAVEDTRAAGITTHIIEPTAVGVDVTCAILLDTGYLFASVSEEVEIALYNYLQSLSADDDVYLAALIEIIMGIDGVINTTISAPAADVEIDSDEIARSGTITITEI